MKQLFSLRRSLLLACFSLGALASQAQSIGVGTNSPSPNAVLDVFSTSKGLMFPRVDTAAVVKPTAGLLIYSQQLNAPAYYNGHRWNKLTGGSSANSTSGTSGTTGGIGAGDITYTITNTSGFVTNGNISGVNSISSGISNPVSIKAGAGGAGAGKATFSDVAIQKTLDDNSVAFVQAVATGKRIASIEFIVYGRSGGPKPVPVYAIKLLNAFLTAYTVNPVSGGDAISEQLSFTAESYGYQTYSVNPDGSQGKASGYTFNVATNTGSTSY